MINALVRHRDGSVQRFSDVNELVECWNTSEAIGWINLEAPAEEDLHGLQRLFGFDSEAVEDCLHGEQRPRVDAYQDHIFLVVYGVLASENGKVFEHRKLAAFFSDRYLVTVHQEPLATVRALLEKTNRDPRPVLANGTDTLLFRLIDGMVDRYILIVDRIEERLEEYEDQSLEPDVDASILAETADLRRELLELRRLAVSQRELLTPFADGEFEDIAEQLEHHFRHVRQHLTQVIEEADALRERLHTVRDNYHTAIANRTNQVMKTLTLFATLLLPTTLIASIYGMNLPLWPPPQEPRSFWLVLGGMAVVATAILIYFRRRKWI